MASKKKQGVTLNLERHFRKSDSKESILLSVEQDEISKEQAHALGFSGGYRGTEQEGYFVRWIGNDEHGEGIASEIGEMLGADVNDLRE